MHRGTGAVRADLQFILRGVGGEEDAPNTERKDASKKQTKGAPSRKGPDGIQEVAVPPSPVRVHDNGGENARDASHGEPSGQTLGEVGI